MGHSPNAALHSSQTTYGTDVLADTRMFWVVFLGPIIAMLLFAMPVLAQSIPENASPKSYGNGWQCNIGYRHVGDNCEAIVVPENAYQTNRAYGLGWECHHGFDEADRKMCIAVVVPDGGYLDHSGERWRCLRGFLKINETCQKIEVPENGYLIDATYGSEWKCERGFEKSGDHCNAIKVPLNGYLNGSSYGQPWKCERGFFENGGLCEKIIIPEFAYYDDATYGDGWKCQRGYEANDTGCEAIDIPANAHLDRSGNRWECNRNFQKSKNQCVLRN